MHLEKRLFYSRNNDTQVGFHTGNGTTQEVIDLDKANKNDIIVNCNIRKVRNKDKNETYMRVNPNKNNNGYILTEYTAFQKVMQDVFEELGVKEFKWKRVDMSFNTMDNKYYTNYTKLNRLLIACIANSTNDKNTYDINGLMKIIMWSMANRWILIKIFYNMAISNTIRVYV